jgi:8-oxo-dGTP diphosphatase
MPDELRIVVGILRSDGRLLMVQQAGPGEDPQWTLPGGRVEAGEFLTDALVREVREETGVAVDDVGRLAYFVQVDNRQDGWFGDVWTFDVADWSGEIAIDDPDGFVFEAAWVELDEVLVRLERTSWHALTVRYLQGDLDPKSAWQRRVHADGSEELIGPL